MVARYFIRKASKLKGFPSRIAVSFSTKWSKAPCGMPVEKIKKAKKMACTEGVIAPTKSCQASKMPPKKMLIQVGVYNMCRAMFFTAKTVWQLVLKKV